jgi:hypothetical protein
MSGLSGVSSEGSWAVRMEIRVWICASKMGDGDKGVS